MVSEAAVEKVVGSGRGQKDVPEDGGGTAEEYVRLAAGAKATQMRTRARGRPDGIAMQHARPHRPHDPHDVGEQRAVTLGRLEPGLLAEAREGLAGEPRREEVVGRHVRGRVHLGDVLREGRHVPRRKVEPEGLARLRLPLAGEHARAAELAQPNAEAADAGEELAEGEGGSGGGVRHGDVVESAREVRSSSLASLRYSEYTRPLPLSVGRISFH